MSLNKVIPEAGISRFHCEITQLGAAGHFQIFPGLMVKLGETEMQVLAQSSAEPSLTVLFTEGPLAGHKVTIPPGGITIGRVADNSLVLVQDGCTVYGHFYEDDIAYRCANHIGHGERTPCDDLPGAG
ncbi:unnamed protein product [Durusdinium trenchii]|uniref:FHA domain-containing protein n=1 Tax=Durusdinium trenchii TaxID=1381693 RepID=A0ABP0S6M2_9DINO